MPLTLAPLLAVLLGVAFGLTGRDEIRRTTLPPSRTRAFLLLMLCSLGLLAPALGYFLAFYPDWAWSYLIAGERVPSALTLIAVLATCTLPLFGFSWTASALRRHAVRELVRVASGLVLLLAAAFAFLGPRMLLVGSTHAFHEGYELSAASATTLGASILWIDGCLLGGILWAASHVRRVAKSS